MSDPCRSRSSPDPRTRRRPASCWTPSAPAGARSRGSSCRRAADVARFERELLGDGATQAGRVTTFAGLTREIARRAGWWARTVGPLQRERLVAQAIADAPLDALAGVAGTPRFPACRARVRRRAGALAGHAAALHRRRARVAGGDARRARGGCDLRPLHARARAARPRRPRAVRLARARRAARATGRVGRDARLPLRLRRLHRARARRGRDAGARRGRGRDGLAAVRARAARRSPGVPRRSSRSSASSRAR